MEIQSPRYYKFGEFTLDSRRRVLSKTDGEVPISAKNFDLLFELIKNEGRILTHNELLDTVWEGTFVEQSNLKKGISALRQILGETPESSLYIKTVPRKGYSFVAPVQVFADESQSFSIKATEIIVEEEIIEDDEPVKMLPAIQPPTFWAKNGKYILGGLAVLLLGSFAYFFSQFFTKQGKRFSVENVRITKLTNDGNCYDASISADGNFILCGVKNNEGSTLITRQVSAKSQVQLLPPQKNITFWAYKITPDGASVYYMLHDLEDASRDGMFQIPFLGGTPRKINNSGVGITFSPDSKKLGFVRITPTTNQILTANMDGSDEKVVAEYGTGHRIWGLNWSPDGKTLLCSARLQTNERFTGFVDEISLSDGSKRRIFENNQLVVSAAWLPDKTSIILGMRELNNEIRQIWQYFPASKELIRVTNDNNTYRFPVLNQAGTVIAVSQESLSGGTFEGEVGNKDLKPFAGESGITSYIAKTNDGRLIYTVREGNEAIWIINADGTGKRQITDGKDGIYLEPRLSHDGKTIVFSSIRSGAKELWRINTDGSGLEKVTKSADEVIINGVLLADGKTLIANSSNAKNANYVWKQDANGQKTILAEKIGLGWDISPDGKSLLYDKYNEATKQAEIVVQSLETNQILQTFPGPVDTILHWNDTNSFIYETNQDNKIRIFKQDVDKSPPALLYEHNAEPNDRIFNFELLPDGKRFILVKAKYLTDAVTIKIEENR